MDGGLLLLIVGGLFILSRRPGGLQGVFGNILGGDGPHSSAPSTLYVPQATRNPDGTQIGATVGAVACIAGSSVVGATALGVAASPLCAAAGAEVQKRGVKGTARAIQQETTKIQNKAFTAMTALGTLGLSETHVGKQITGAITGGAAKIEGTVQDYAERAYDKISGWL
jgi:hypothetical protein